MDPREALQTWLADQSVKPGTFARRVGYDRGNFHRILNGDAWPSLELALRIEQETAGSVLMSSWALAKAA